MAARVSHPDRATSTSPPKIAALRAGDAGVGAVCSFIGTVRDRNDGSAASARWSWSTTRA